MPAFTINGVVTDDSGASYNFNGAITPVVQGQPPVNPHPVDPPPVDLPTNDPIDSVPLSWDADRFSRNVASGSTRIVNGGTIAYKSITDTGSVASIVTGNGATIQNCRIKSREGVRIGGGGNFLIDGCYIEVNGIGDDHADGVQAYAPGSKGSIKVRNTLIKCGINQATAGFFIADNWTGIIDFDGVVVQGGPYGVRIHPDKGGDNTILFKNVFVVGPFRYDGLWIDDRTLGGHKNVIEIWENVREATIVNSVLVPGKAIPRPF